MALLIGFIGLFIIGFIVWWFWLSQPRTYAGQVNDVIEIKVKDGIYYF